MPARVPLRDAVVVGLGVATLAGGIPLDASGAWWAQPVVSLWAWAALALVASLSTPDERLELAACVGLATAGELFLKDVWGLYAYRLGNLPLFIPAGHALVYATASRLSRMAPAALPGVVTTVFAAVVGAGAWRGTDTLGVLWFAVYLAYLARASNRALCASLFIFALGIETYGTALGGWQYFTVEPWFGLTTTNPPVWIGAVYCTLEGLVRAVSARPVPVTFRLAGRRIAALL